MSTAEAASPAQAPQRVFVSYSRTSMRSEGEAVVRALGRHGAVVDSAIPEIGEDWASAAAVQIPRADLMLVLIAPGDELRRSVLYEMRLMLQHCWDRPDARIAVVAPAVGAIPKALRHQPFVHYYPDDEVGLSRWDTEVSVDNFVSQLLESGSSTAHDPPVPFSDSEIRDWRNRIAHIGIDGLPDDASQVSRLRSQLASDLNRFEPFVTSAGLTDSRVEREQIRQTLEQVLDRATLARTIGDQGLATEYYAIAQQIYEVDPPQSPVEQAAFWYSFGLFAMDTGDYKAARDRFSRAVDIDARVLGPDHPATITARYQLGLTFERLGNDTAAVEAYQKAFEAAVAALGDHHTQTANIAYRLGLMREKLGDSEGAISLLTLAADAYRRARPDDSPELQAALQQITRLTSAQ